MKRTWRAASLGLAAMLLVSISGCATRSPYLEGPARDGHCGDVPSCLRVLGDERSTWEELQGASEFVRMYRDEGTFQPAPDVKDTLRAMLREELRVPRARLASNGVEGEDPAVCLESASAHTPRAVFIIRTLAGILSLGESTPSELIDAAHEPDPRVSLAATLVLAYPLEDDAALPGLAHVVESSSDVACMNRVVGTLGRPEFARRASPLLPALMRWLEGDVPSRVVPWLLPRVLEQIDNPVVTEALGRSLAKDEHLVRYEALRALAHFGASSLGQAAAIRALADNWAPDVRDSAATALHAIGEPPPLPHVARRPSLAIPTRGGWDVTLSSGTVALSADVEPGPTPPQCTEAALALARSGEAHSGVADGALLVEGACLFEVFRPFSNQVPFMLDPDGNPLLLPFRVAHAVTVHGHALVLGRGSIGTIERIDGAPRPRRIAALPGAVLAYGLDASGDLIVLTTGEFLGDNQFMYTDSGPSPSGPSFVLRLGSDEQLSEAF